MTKATTTAAGLMAGIASMSLIAALVLAQKLPERLAVDVPMALAIVALGVTVAVGP